MRRLRFGTFGARLKYAGVISAAMVLPACSSLTTLTVRPTKPSQLELVPAPQLSQKQYKRILLLPPEENVRIGEGIEAPVVGQKDMRFYIAHIEKAMLAKGFEVVSPEIVARAGSAPGAGTRSAAERAMVMGKQTQADAVLQLQSISVQSGEKFYH